jgi:hypothetical protein
MGFPLQSNYPVIQVSYLTALWKTLVGDLFLGDEVKEPSEAPTFADIIRFAKIR